MAHFAEIKDGIVQRVIVIDNNTIDNKEFPESEPIGIAFCKSLFGEDTQWLQCSYNENFRGVYPSIDAKYDSDNDIFVNDDYTFVDNPEGSL